MRDSFQTSYLITLLLITGSFACRSPRAIATEPPGTVRIGNPFGPDWAWADVPESVVKRAGEVLKPPVEKWTAAHSTDFGNTSHRIVTLYDENRNNCRFSVNSGKWVRLGGEEGFKVISSMYGGKLAALTGESDRHEVGRLCVWLAYLHRGPKRTYLSSDFWTRNPSQNAWMAGEIKSKRNLEKYFINPVLGEGGAEKILAFYIITGNGGVEHWQVRISQQGSVGKVAGITVSEVMKEGSFSWGLVP